MQAIVTPGNRYDSPVLLGIIDDLAADYVLADAGYESKTDNKAVKAIDAKPDIAFNPRRGNARRSNMPDS